MYCPIWTNWNSTQTQPISVRKPYMNFESHKYYLFYGLTKGIDNQNITSSSLSSIVTAGVTLTQTDVEYCAVLSELFIRNGREETAEDPASTGSSNSSDPPMEGNDGRREDPRLEGTQRSIPQDRFVWYIFLQLPYNYHIFQPKLRELFNIPCIQIGNVSRFIIFGNWENPSQ